MLDYLVSLFVDSRLREDVSQSAMGIRWYNSPGSNGELFEVEVPLIPRLNSSAQISAIVESIIIFHAASIGFGTDISLLSNGAIDRIQNVILAENLYNSQRPDANQLHSLSSAQMFFTS